MLLCTVHVFFLMKFCFLKARLVREMEKKFSGKHIVVVAQVYCAVC